MSRAWFDDVLQVSAKRSAAKQDNHDDDGKEEAKRTSADVIKISEKGGEEEMHKSSFSSDDNSFAVAFCGEVTRSVGVFLWGVTLPRSSRTVLPNRFLRPCERIEFSQRSAVSMKLGKASQLRSVPPAIHSTVPCECGRNARQHRRWSL